MATLTLIENLRRKVFNEKEEEETKMGMVGEPLYFDPNTSGVILMSTKWNRIELVREAL